MANLEHVNLTVSNPQATAAMLCKLFDWEIRWEGEAMDSGSVSYTHLTLPTILLV